MNHNQPICKITGDAKIEKLKERIWRIQLSVGSLERTLKTLIRVWDEFQKPEDQRDVMLLEALTFYAVVEYTKCFNSDLGDKLDLGIFEDNLPINPGPADLSAREFHTLIMKYRNEHLVHSDRLLKVADTGGMKFSTGDYAVGSVVATRSYREGVSFYGSLNSLTTTALQEAIKRREAGQQRLMAALKTGEAIVTDETIQLMPISDELTPREMSGLPPRS